MTDHTDLLQGARNAVRVCMNVGASDRVFILTDNETLSIAKALKSEAKAAGAEAVYVPLDEFGARPMTSLPEELAKRIVAFSPTVTYYAASTKENELGMRGGLIGLSLGELHARHAHMPEIREQIMRGGMRADYYQVNELTRRVYELVRGAKVIHVTSSDGMDLTARFADKFLWTPMGGLYHSPGDFGNLPEGEVYTTPASVDGVFMAQVLGDYFSAKYGVLSQPLKIEIADSQATKISGQPAHVAAELSGYLGAAENGLRVGEFAIGTNIGIRALCGFMLQDEKIPGVHIAFGDPLGGWTGADWHSTVHVDVVNSFCTIEVDGRLLMKKGRFVFHESA